MRQRSFTLRFGKYEKAFTLLEVLIVLGIAVMIAGIIASGLRGARRKADVTSTGLQQKIIAQAVELYFNDMGFFPPDVNRGWDPGLVERVPWNPDELAGETIPGGYADPDTDCSHCPLNWESILNSSWNGPYLNSWPRTTRWNGKYDYNYWPEQANRYGCPLAPGVYIGVQGDYNNENIITSEVEQMMIDEGFDAEQCLNSESQMFLHALP